MPTNDPAFTQEDLYKLTQPKEPPTTDQPAAPVPLAKKDSAVGTAAMNVGSLGGEGLSQEDLAAFGHNPDTDTTASDIFREYAKGAVAGGIETAPAISGAIYGSRLAPFVAPFMGPAAPFAPLVTGGVGAFAGVLAGKPLSEVLIQAPDNKDLLPYYEGGKTFGSTVAFAPAAFYLPETIGTRVGPYIAGIGKFARKYPKSYLLGETSGGVSSSGGAILAEENYPGQAGPRFAAEATFGVLNPLRIVPNITSWGAGKLKTLWSMRTAQGREALAASGMASAQDEASRRLIEILERHGEDIPALIKALDEQLPGKPAVAYPPPGGAAPITGPTAAQKTGSLPLAQLEAALGTLDPNFGAELNEQGRQSLLAFSKVIQGLENVGSPDALRVAAEMKQQFFDNAINSRLERAMARAGEKIGKITKDTPEARVQIGQLVRDEVETALENSRTAERFYWQAADREAQKPAGKVRLQVQPSETLINNTYLSWASNLLPELKRMRASDVDFRNAAAVSRLLNTKAVPLSVFIKNTGGIANDSELLARDITNKMLPGLVRQNVKGNVVGERGKASIDAVKERVFSAGYFPMKADYNQISDSELYDAIARDLTSDERVWTMDIRAKLDPFINEREVLDSWAKEGFEATMTKEQIANRARALDDLARKEGKEGFYVSEQQLPGPTEKVIPRPRQLTAENTVRAYLERVSQIGPALVDSMIPPNVRKIMESFGITDSALELYRRGRATDQFAKTGIVHYRYLPDKSRLEKIKPGDLINYRSNLLDLARQARGRGEVSDASFYSYLADAMLQDLSKLDNPAYNKAREFSNALNDVFTRTFANELLGSAKTGAARYPAETLVADSFGAGADLTTLRMREIENAVGFMRDRLQKAAAEAGPRIRGDKRLENEAQMLREFAQVSTQGVASIQDAQNRVLRLLASKATFLDPKTNSLRVNTRQLNRFVSEYKPLLDQLGITNDLTNAVQAENLLHGVLQQNSYLNKTVRDQMAFSQILGFESPTAAIGSVLRSKFPMRSMARIARLAQRSGPDAVDGLKSTVYDYVFTKASGGTEMLDPQKFRDAFFKPLSKDAPTLADILRTQGIMSPQELNNIRTLTDRMMRIEDAVANRVGMENVSTGADAVTELALRVIGSKIGSSASGGGPGSLIAASAGSKAVRQLFDKMPMMMVRKTLQRAVQDPAFMAQLLRRTASEREKFSLARSLNSYMLASGLTYATYDEPPEAKQTTSTSAAGELSALDYWMGRAGIKQKPPAPATRGVPGMKPAAPPAPPTSGAPTGGPPTAGSPTQSRLMMQQLFPNDAILGAAALNQAQQGVG